MKKLLLPILTALLLLSLVPTQLSAVSGTTPNPVPVESVQTEALLSRLDEINTMDKSELNSSNKKALRKEVRGIRQELRAGSSGIYISAGAIIIILLLLIILL
ncbi:MAG: hypothetical protein KDC34_19370 [Saprospiraceae bacterium]|nr:hypothetical protein [Saprospiraceae bacterium]